MKRQPEEWARLIAEQGEALGKVARDLANLRHLDKLTSHPDSRERLDQQEANFRACASLEQIGRQSKRTADVIAKVLRKKRWGIFA